MKFLYMLFIVYATTAEVQYATSATLVGGQDPQAEDNNGILWRDQQQVLLQERLNNQDDLIRKSFNHSQKWTTILRRQDGSVDFYRNWAEYRKGFGNPDGEFFIGLDKLHIMTTYGAPQELLVVLGVWGNRTVYAKYDHFQVGNEQEKYNLKEVGRYSGNAGDPLSYHKGMNFTTKDQDNDLASYNCAIATMGAWWFDRCRYSHLNGIYRSKNMSHLEGIIWFQWNRNIGNINFAEMLIRSRL